MRGKLIEGISELRDESDKDGVRLVIELKREAMADVVLNQLYRYTPLQTTFSVNALALDGGRPKLMSLKELLEAFIRFRADVLTRRTHISILTPDRGIASAAEVAELVGEVLGWSPDEVQLQAQHYLDRVAAEIAAQQVVTDAEAADIRNAVRDFRLEMAQSLP